MSFVDVRFESHRPLQTWFRRDFNCWKVYNSASLSDSLHEMDLGINFASKLEPFLLMAKSLKGAAAAKLIQDATSAPGVFVFSELLELPNIQEVRQTVQIIYR